MTRVPSGASSEEFRGLLKRHREARRWSQERLAAEADMDHSLVSRLESGQRCPTRDAIGKLAAVLMPLPLYVALVWLSGEWTEYRDRWVASGTYPGRPDDGVLTWARHLRANWRRFERADAVAGRAYGGE